MEIVNYAPVIIPTLCRFEHFKRCLESLEQCTGAHQTEVYVGLDYPPSEKFRQGWRKIDEYLSEKETNHGFKRLTVFRRNKNCGVKGAGANSSLLVGYICSHYDCYIITEDDNVFAPNFLAYMNQCLEKYKDNPSVIAVTGYSHPLKWRTSPSATVQLQNFNASAWGIGFWKKKMRMVSANISSGKMYDKAAEILKSNKWKDFIFVAFYEYVCASIIPVDFLRKIQSGRLGMTDYSMRQYLCVYDKYIVSPLISKVRNTGFDGSGIYCQNTDGLVLDNSDAWHTDFSHQEIDRKDTFEIVENDPDLLKENQAILDKYEYRPLTQHIVAGLIASGIRVFGLAFMRWFATTALKIWHRRIN